MSRSYHQSRKLRSGGSSDFIFETDKKYKVKNKYKGPKIVEDFGKRKVIWKRKKHLAYGEQRNFRFKGEPTYTNEVYIKNVGEICFPCIVKRKARKNNKISIYDNFEQL